MKICNRYPKELLHYDNYLKRRYFRKLKDNVWESKTKWQLLVKADWTYRYKLLLSCFLPWLTYTKQKIQRKNKIQEADSHYLRKIKYKAFSFLKRNGEQQWLIIKNLRNSIDLKILRKTWNCWEKYIRKNIRAKEISVLTVKTRELLLIQSYLRLWFTNYNEKKVNQKLYSNAEAHYSYRIQLKTMKMWKDYFLHRKKKTELDAYFLKNFQLKLKREAFNRLMRYSGQKKLYRKHLERIALFYENYLLKNVLDIWNIKYEELIEYRNKDKNSLAVKIYERNIYAKCFKKLKLWFDKETLRISTTEKFFNISVTIKIQYYLEVLRKSLYHRLLSKSMEIKAVTWRNFQIKKIYLSTLMALLEQKREEAKRIEDLINYCNFKILSRAFHDWLRFLYGKRVKRSENDKARRHHESKISQKFFKKLKYYVAYKIRKNSVVTYHEERLLSKAFKNLKIYCEKKRFYRFQIASFQDRSKRQILQHAFSLFKHRSKIAEAKMWNACNMSESRIKKRALEQWKKHCESKKETEAMWNTNRLLLVEILIRDVISTWWKNTQSQIELKEDLKIVKMNQDKRLVKKFFKKWISIREKFKLQRQNTLFFKNLQSDIKLQYYIMKLASLWEEKSNERKKKIMADAMEKKILLRSFFKQWIAYVSWKVQKLKECSSKVGSSVNKSDRIDKNNYICTTKSKRKQPMIPAYLRKEWALSAMEGKPGLAKMDLSFGRQML